MGQENDTKPHFKKVITSEKPGKISYENTDGTKEVLTNPVKRKHISNEDEVVDSMLPYFEKVFSGSPGLLAVDRNFWLELTEDAFYKDPIKAAQIARKAGYSAHELSDRVLTRIQEKSSNWNPTFNKVTDDFRKAMEKRVAELFSGHAEIYTSEAKKFIK